MLKFIFTGLPYVLDKFCLKYYHFLSFFWNIAKCWINCIFAHGSPGHQQIYDFTLLHYSLILSEMFFPIVFLVTYMIFLWFYII
jgi:hypothetical protein